MKIVALEDNEKNGIVKKHNDLIVAKGNLSSTAQKMLAMLIGMIRQDDDDFQKYALHIETYKKVTGSTHKGKEKYVAQALELMNNPFYITDNGKRKFFNWCSLVQPDEKRGYIIFEIHRELRPYLLQFKKEVGNFTQYYIANIMNLKGKYSPRIYELFIKDLSKQSKYKSEVSVTYEVEWIREFLRLPKGYRYNHIKSQIIDKTREDFKLYTNIEFNYRELKSGRKITAVEFKIQEKDKKSVHLENKKSYITFLRKHFINKDILQASDKYSREKIILSISEDGLLYDKISGKTFSKERASELWGALYERASKKSDSAV